MVWQQARESPLDIQEASTTRSYPSIGPLTASERVVFLTRSDRESVGLGRRNNEPQVVRVALASACV